MRIVTNPEYGLFGTNTPSKEQAFRDLQRARLAKSLLATLEQIWRDATRAGVGVAASPPRSVLAKSTLEMFEELPFEKRQEFYRKHQKWILQELQTFRGR